MASAVKVYIPTVTIPQTEAEWLRHRLSGIGASEASAVLGMNPYISNVALWRIKTGRTQAADISEKECVQYGHAAEGYIRELFALDHPEYIVSYGGAFDVVHHAEYPFIFATLDGRLQEVETGLSGVYEGKTAEIMRGTQREKWTNGVPQNYYVQILHQMIATGFAFAELNARMKTVRNGSDVFETRHYRFDRTDHAASIDYLMQEELKFWEYVEADREPPLILPQI